MVVTFLLIGSSFLAWPLATGLANSSRGRERDRRLRYLARHPQQVNAGDICRLLSRELARDEVNLVVDRAQALGIRPWTMLSWMQRFDVHTLTVVIAAELSHEELLLHLGNGTLPDLDELGVFAALNGLPIAAKGPDTPLPVMRPPVPAARRTAAAAVGSGQDTSLPPIFEPGSWPYDQFGSDLPAWPEGPVEPGSLAA